MENHLEIMQADVDEMGKVFGDHTDEPVSTEEATPDTTEPTLDSMIDNDEDAVVEEVLVDEEIVINKPKKATWKTRYSQYKTKTDATIFELRKENSNLISQIQLLNTRVDEMRVSTEDATSFVDRFTDIDKEILGEDALNSLEQATNAAVEPLKQQLAEEKAWRAQQLELQRSKSKQEASTYFLTALANAVPDYAEIDTNPAFAEWMDSPDIISGIPRVKLFKQAETAGDVHRVANFMNDFKEATKPVDKLKDKVTPVSTSSTSPTFTQGEKISMADVNKFYDDTLKGIYRGNEDKRLEMEAKVNKALAEGNVY